eukprot:gene6823-28172_t
MLRHLKRLRDRYDPRMRPIMSTWDDWTLQALITGGRKPPAPVDIYKDTMEVVMLTVHEMNEEKVRQLVDQVHNPILPNIWADSIYGINSTKDEAFQAKLLKNNTIVSLDMHRKHELLGVCVTEWEDQWWRAQSSNPDNDCPDPRHGKHSDCAQRSMRFNDGELQLEYLGLWGQYQTWFKHCIHPKAAYFSVAEVLVGQAAADALPREDDCVFIFLTYWKRLALIIASSVICCCGCVLFLLHLRSLMKERTDTARGAQAGDCRWVQPDTNAIARTVVRHTMR